MDLIYQLEFSVTDHDHPGRSPQISHGCLVQVDRCSDLLRGDKGHERGHVPCVFETPEKYLGVPFFWRSISAFKLRL